VFFHKEIGQFKLNSLCGLIDWLIFLISFVGLLVAIYRPVNGATDESSRGSTRAAKGNQIRLIWGGGDEDIEYTPKATQQDGQASARLFVVQEECFNDLFSNNPVFSSLGNGL